MHDTIFDKVKDLLHFLLGAEGGLQDVTIWHLDSDLGTGVMGLPLNSVELDGATVSELSLLFLVSDEGQSTPTFIFISDFVEDGRYFASIFAPNHHSATSLHDRGLSTSVDHRRGLALILHFLVPSSRLVLFLFLNCSCFHLSLLHHGKELVGVHGRARHVCLLVVDLNLSVFHAVFKGRLTLLQNRIDLFLLRQDLGLGGHRGVLRHGR